MSPRRPILHVLAVLLLVGCGSSHRSAPAGTASGSQTTAAPSPTAPATSTAATTTTTTTTTAPQPGNTSTTTPSSGGGSQGVRLPATFVIRTGGRLTPPTVSSPAFLAIELSVSSGDGRRHRVVLLTPKRHLLSVPAGGRASALIPGQRPGHYPLLVDGARRGALEVGGEPGP